MLLLMLALSLSSGQVTLPDNGPTFNSMPSDPASCFTGAYRIAGEHADHHTARCSGFKKCEPGFYCAKDNIKRSCPAGRYGRTAGLTSASCSGPCPLGYYCPQQTSDPIQCGGSNVFCPLESPEPKIARQGFYTIGADTPKDPKNTTQHREQLCEAGFYCIDGIKMPCPAGR